MKREIDVPGIKLIVVYRIIVVIMLLLVTLLIAGSLYAFIRSRDSGPLFRLGGKGGGLKEGVTSQAGQGSAAREGDNPYNVFSGIGTLRVQNTGKQEGAPSEKASGKSAAKTASEIASEAVIIVSISFPYKADDRAFTEELASHLVDFRSVATNYFANLPRDKLSKLDEEQAKADILKQYNALLRLGRIETLYFSDLMVVE
jgi:flagellar basal body-associated protein FliL